MLDLLEPQLRLQITIRIPDYYFVASELPSLVKSTIEFFLSEKTPFRLFYNFIPGKPQSDVSRSPRFTQNLAVWLVFYSIQRKSDVLDLDMVMSSCSLGTLFGFSTTVHRDFIQVIVDDSAVAEPWSGACKSSIDRAYVPLYLVTLSWSGTHFRSDDALLVRETCGWNDDSSFSIVANLIPKMKESNGIERLLKHIRLEKKDFRGRKVNVCPTEMLSDRWVAGSKEFFTPFSFQTAHKDWESALASVFDSFIPQHNFTIDFVDWAGSVNYDMKEAVIRVISIFGCSQPWYQCYAHPLSLFRFQHYRTLVFSRPVQPEPFDLLSLKAPFSDCVAVLMLLGASLSMATVLKAVVSKSRDISAEFLSIFSGLIGKSFTKSGTCELFHTFWLFLAGVVSVTYMNTLQSYVIVPGARYNGLCFEDMAKRNYTFESTLWGWMKNITNYNAATVLSRREKILSEQVEGRGQISHIWLAG